MTILANVGHVETTSTAKRHGLSLRGTFFIASIGCSSRRRVIDPLTVRANQHSRAHHVLDSAFFVALHHVGHGRRIELEARGIETGHAAKISRALGGRISGARCGSAVGIARGCSLVTVGIGGSGRLFTTIGVARSSSLVTVGVGRRGCLFVTGRTAVRFAGSNIAASLIRGARKSRLFVTASGFVAGRGRIVASDESECGCDNHRESNFLEVHINLLGGLGYPKYNLFYKNSLIFYQKQHFLQFLRNNSYTKSYTTACFSFFNKKRPHRRCRRLKVKSDNFT